jgi:uncharacterized Rmd1/YagE family protein
MPPPERYPLPWPLFGGGFGRLDENTFLVHLEPDRELDFDLDVEVGERPDPTWDRPELSRLYSRLEDEYELRERLVALEQKLAPISKTVETALGISQRNSSHRVEWYIVILIVVEIVLSIYDLWIRN